MRSARVEHERVKTDCSTSKTNPAMTKQADKEACNINNIMAKYQKTGLLEHTAKYQGRYENVSGAVEYQQGLELVRQAEEAFASLPSSIRKRFDNSPGYFLAFVSDPANAEEVQELGLGREPIAPAEPLEPAEPAPTPPPVEPVA